MYSDYKTSKFPGYFMWIDGLRGIAAVFVVIFHFHHFYLADADARLAIPDPATFPYAQLLQPVFVYGSHAVELFWVISGFVFTHVYLDAPTSLRGFAVARFARLYPLHFLTLCYVALLQILSFNLAGHWQVYGHNDLRHFVLQLFLSSNWNTLGLGLSFNGPIWSVSLETVIYAVFFVSLTALRRLKSVTAVSLCVLFWIAVFQWPTNFPFLSSGIAECGGYFYFGSCLYFAIHSAALRILSLILTSLVLVSGIVAGHESLAVFGISGFLVIAAAMLDMNVRHGNRIITALGQSSYSIYLIHVPLQMTILLAADLFFAGTRAFALSHVTLPLFLTASLLLALICYHKLEKPAGRALRRILGGGNPT